MRSGRVFLAMHAFIKISHRLRDKS